MSHTPRSDSLREKLHEALDDVLEEMGVTESHHPEFGAVIVELKFENKKPSLKITERIIERQLKG